MSNLQKESITRKKRVVLQQKRKVQKNLLSSFNDNKQEASVADDYIDNGGFYDYTLITNLMH